MNIMWKTDKLYLHCLIGVDEENDPGLTVSKARIDKTRIKYHHDHLVYVKQAVDV